MATLTKIVFIFMICNAVKVTPVSLLDLLPSIGSLLNTRQSEQQHNTVRPTCGNAPPSCNNSRYRSIDGVCNNLNNPLWGTPFTTFERMLPNSYSDGKHQLTRSRSGRDLPSAREISLHMSPDVIVFDSNFTLCAMQWGQTVVHDMSLSDNVPQSESGISTCCQSGQLNDAAKNTSVCAPIIIPCDDPYNAPEGKMCLDFIRGQTDRDRNCSKPNAPYEQINSVTSYMDMSLMYGNSDEEARSLRTGKGGRLVIVTRKGQAWPPQDPNPTQTCSVESSNESCYLAGDVRINQSPELAILQVVFLREHNRIADFLQQLNPHWDDETVYQESRRIVIAQMQHINYYEYLPNIIGYNNMVKNKLIYPNSSVHINDYNSKVNPAILNEHTTVAYRYFHSMIYGFLKLYLENRESIDIIRLSNWFNKPEVIEEGDNFVRLVRGLVTQPASASDRFFDDEIINYLFRNGKKLGGDLHSIDIQRGRDHGIGRYADARAICGLPNVTKFSDLEDFIPKNYVKLLQSFYDDVRSVELAVAGALEKHVPGTLAGPTFLCILTEQFFRTRVGDRYFFENGEDPLIALSQSQLNDIRKHSLARLLCDNVDGLSIIQPRAFELISDTNSLVPCQSITTLNLTLWKDTSNNVDLVRALLRNDPIVALAHSSVHHLLTSRSFVEGDLADAAAATLRSKQCVRYDGT